MTIVKKILLAGITCCLSAVPSMFGANLNAFCTPTGTFTNGSGGPISESCASFTSDGGGTIGNAAGQDTITGITLYLLSDFQLGTTSGVNSVKLTYAAPSMGTWSLSFPASCTVSGTGGNSSANTCTAYSGNMNAPGTTSASDTDGTLNADAGSPFTVAVSSAVVSGAMQTSSGDLIVSYNYTVNSATPEPATLGLVGSALLGLGLLVRKRSIR